MAIGTLVLVNQHNKLGPVFHDHITFVGPASYPIGGSDIQTKLRIETGDQRTPFAVMALDKNGYFLFYDFTNTKLMIFRSNDAPAALSALTSAALTGGGAASLGAANGVMEDMNDAVAGVDGMGSNAASKANVDTRLVAIGNNLEELYEAVNKLVVDVTMLATATTAIVDGPGVEVPDTTNLSAITFQCLVLSR